MITHRCERSLKEGASIRFGKKYDFLDSPDAWHLRQTVFDSEWGAIYLGQPMRIYYCPFCGEKLEVQDEAKA